METSRFIVAIGYFSLYDMPFIGLNFGPQTSHKHPTNSSRYLGKTTNTKVRQNATAVDFPLALNEIIKTILLKTIPKNRLEP